MGLYENYGKQHYCKIALPDGPWTWCYSAEALQRELAGLLPGQRLRGCYVSLLNYLDAVHSKPNVIELSETGGTSLLVFETAALALRFRGEGMAEYRILPAGDLPVQEVCHWLPDDLVSSPSYYFDIARHDGPGSYAGKRVEVVRVPRTTVWAFPAPGFDEDRADRAAAAFDLPCEVYLTFEDGSTLRFLSDEYAYYSVLMEGPETSR